MRKVLLLTVVGILALGVVPAAGQGDWVLSDPPEFVYDGVLTDSVSGGHGIVVDKYNRIWVGNYNYSPMGIRVFNADGTEASFSPIDSVTFPWGTGDTTVHTTLTGSCRGMNLDNDGNILYTHASKLMRINVEDGTGMNFHIGSYSSYSKAAQDADGYIYIAQVVPGDDGPVVVLNDDFTLAQEISVERPPWSRAMEVTSDGMTMFLPNLLGGSQKLPIYTTTDFVNYALTDSIHTNTAGDTIIDAGICGVDWGPDGGLWLSGWGKTGDNHVWRFDLTNRTYGVLAMVDTALGFDDNDARGVAFSVTGDTMYVISWESPHVFRFVAGTASVRADRGIPEGYALLQNFPNPFNPSTEIRYEIGKMELTSLVIYNLVGGQVRTLVNTVQPAGEYRVVWDGRDSKGLLLPSGMYVYRLRTGTVTMSKRMILIK